MLGKGHEGFKKLAVLHAITGPAVIGENDVGVAVNVYNFSPA